MNRYDKLYNFRMAKISDAERVMKFIRLEWGTNHILGKDKDLFLWQYGRTEYGDKQNINIVLMTDKEDEILGMIGFVSYDKENNFISPAITKVSSRELLPMTGVEFMRRQMQIVGEKEHFASGANNKTILPLYERVFHHKTGVMQQYYMINPNIKNFKIAQINHNFNCQYRQTDYSLKKIESFKELTATYDLKTINDWMPFKSPEFVEKRYFNHPIYNYIKWVVRDNDGKCVGVLFGREIQIFGAKVLRLVDYRGDLNHLKKLGGAFHDILVSNEYEYIDLMVSDLSQYNLEEAGFSLLDLDGDTIIPHYFEPFIKENKRNYYQTRNDIVIFKADGDQDRPNERK